MKKTKTLASPREAAASEVIITLEGLQEYDKKLKAKMDGQIEANTAQVFKSQKTDLTTADTKVIEDYFTAHTDVTPRKGDVFVVETLVESTVYEMSAYSYTGDAWLAMTGNVDASKVILREDIKMAGAYTQVGNLTKTQTGTADFVVKGKSVAEALTEIFSKRLQPKAPTEPSVSGFALTGAKAVEVGTKVTEAQFGTAVLNPGSYEFGPATGITAQSFKVDRVCAPASLSKESVGTAASGTDNNDGNGFIIGDGNEEHTVTSLKYKVTASYGDGAIAFDNLGSASNPEVKIAAGSKAQETSAYTGYRSFFSGATTDMGTIDSAFVRKLKNSNAAYKAQTLTISVPAGSTRVVVACIGTAKGVTKVINETSMNADVTSAFTKQTVAVEGANGYTAKDYNAWVFQPAVAFEQAATLKVTLG